MEIFIWKFYRRWGGVGAKKKKKKRTVMRLLII